MTLAFIQSLKQNRLPRPKKIKREAYIAKTKLMKPGYPPNLLFTSETKRCFGLLYVSQVGNYAEYHLIEAGSLWDFDFNEMIRAHKKDSHWIFQYEGEQFKSEEIKTRFN
ncbi:hypothetical protein [Paenibacillus thiaminolyticus]|uniref:Uncharacterized protein n=1 Tax=Paenibacillus thiaminolyticus TaxID=49283 RepID=A0A3A3GD13_PANTH|nr:hypothetical protein [Paenibacillus thiaminolyticus]RJG21365.1 hypothetical protein DQX05_21955 [Paenibacillus thiaminolyticus]